MKKYTWLVAVCGALALVAIAQQVTGIGARAGSPIHPIDELVRASATDAPDFQAAMLADGVITRAEYESASRAAWQCIKNSGVPIGDQVERLDGTLVATVGPFATYEEGAAVQPLIDGCNTRFRDRVALAWFLQNQPSAETLAAARASLGACLRDAGIDVPENAASAEFAAIARGGTPEFARCSERVSMQFKLPGFGG